MSHIQFVDFSDLDMSLDEGVSTLEESTKGKERFRLDLNGYVKNSRQFAYIGDILHVRYFPSTPASARNCLMIGIGISPASTGAEERELASPEYALDWLAANRSRRTTPGLAD
jgi:hypothetical protein